VNGVNGMNCLKYKFIASDLDGTLLNDASEISERTKFAILRVVEAGAVFVAATGRGMSGVAQVNALFDRDMPFITLNGAMVVMGKCGKLLVNRHLGFELAREVFDLGVSLGVSVVVWTGRRLWVSRECEDTISYQGVAGTGMGVISDIDEIREEEGVSKVLWIDSPDSIRRFHREMSGRYGDRLNCYPSQPVFLEFVSLDTDKAIALEEIGKVYGIDRSEMIAVGDGYNDVSMLKYAGLGVAMGNAPDDVKAVCGFVTRSNNEDGVAAVIEEFML